MCSFEEKCSFFYFPSHFLHLIWDDEALACESQRCLPVALILGIVNQGLQRSCNEDSWTW